MGGQQNLGSPSGAFPQAPAPATGSSIMWQWLAPHLVSLFNQPQDSASAATLPSSASGAQVAPAQAFPGLAPHDPTEQPTAQPNLESAPTTPHVVLADPAILRHQMRELDRQLKAGQQPDPNFLQSLIQQGAIWQEEDGGWSGILPRSGAQSDRLVRAMDAFADYLNAKGLPPPRQIMPTIGYLGTLPPEGAQ